MVPIDIMRTELEAIEHARRSPRARASAEVLGRHGMKVIGDQPGRRFMAFAEGEIPTLAVRNDAALCNVAAVMYDAPGARRSEGMIDFPGLGPRRATLVPLAVVMEPVMTPRAHVYAFGARKTEGK